MKIEKHHYQAAIGNYFLCSEDAENVAEAISKFNDKMDESITDYDIYRNGHLVYRYQRIGDKLYMLTSL